jgi:iron complex outermembrane receptor protein
VLQPPATRPSFGSRTQKREKPARPTPAGIDDRVNAWELGASQPLGAGVTAYARIGRSFRLANVDEFSFTATGAGLLPQTSRDVEAGARWADAKSSVDARVYRNALTHEIGFDPAAGPFGFGANVNFDPTKRQGVEIDAAHALTSTLGLRLNAGVRKASFRAGPYAGRDVPLVPRRTVALRADWAVAEGHRVSGGVNWVSSQHPDFANACAMPSYTVADVRYAYTWRAAELSLGVNNLADRKYYTQAFRCAAGVTTAIYPEAGRAVTAALRVKF